jgi:hypothetical protein
MLQDDLNKILSDRTAMQLKSYEYSLSRLEADLTRAAEQGNKEYCIYHHSNFNWDFEQTGEVMIGIHPWWKFWKKQEYKYIGHMINRAIEAAKNTGLEYSIYRDYNYWCHPANAVPVVLVIYW